MADVSHTFQAIGLAGAILTTVCWVPQAWRVIRHRNTHAISLPPALR